MSIYICLCMKVMADKTNKFGWCLSHYSKAWNWFHFFRSHWIPIPMIFPLKLITQVREAFYPHFIPMMFPLRNTKPTNHQLSSVQNPDYSRLSSILGVVTIHCGNHVLNQRVSWKDSGFGPLLKRCLVQYNYWGYIWVYKPTSLLYKELGFTLVDIGSPPYTSIWHGYGKINESGPFSPRHFNRATGTFSGMPRATDTGALKGRLPVTLR